MRLLVIQPPHEFVEADLPPMPGVKSTGKIVQCRKCGLMGHMVGAYEVRLLPSPQRAQRAHDCNGAPLPPAKAWYARITAPSLPDAGPTHAHLTPGSVHAIIPLPAADSLRILGVWVPGPSGPVKLAPGDFEPFQVRTRRRAPKGGMRTTQVDEARPLK